MTIPPLSLDVVASPSELGDAVFRDRSVVVIDVLRATTVIGHALAAGAEKIIPAGSVEQAIELKSHLDPRTSLLCGERGGYRVPGFDLGNSPLEYLPHVVQGRTLILASTNGSVILTRCATARRVLIVSFNILSAVAGRIREVGGDWTFICSGKLGRGCLEDLVCAGRLAAALGAPFDETKPPSDAAGDGLSIALAVHQHHGKDPGGMLRKSAHGRYLASIGFEDDLEVCAAVDTLDLVPELIEGRLVASPSGRGGPSRGHRSGSIESSESGLEGPPAPRAEN